MYLERLALCPGTEDRQGAADLAALEDPRRGWRASQLRYISGRKGELRETLAGDRCAWNTGRVSRLISWGPLRRDGPHRVCGVPALPQRGLPSPVLGLGIRTASEASYWKWRSQTHSSLRKTMNQSLFRQIQWDTLGRGSQAAGWPTKGTSHLRLASGVLRAASSVPWSGGPAGDGRSSCSRDPRRGGEPPSSATFLAEETERSARWRPCALEHWQG